MSGTIGATYAKQNQIEISFFFIVGTYGKFSFQFIIFKMQNFPTKLIDRFHLNNP